MERSATKVALVQCPAWGILPPLGPAALKAYLSLHGIESRCFDLNAAYYHEEQRAREADTSGAYGGTDPWGAESYAQWGLDDEDQGEDGPIRFKAGSVYNERSLPIARWADELLAWGPDVVGFSVNLTSFTTSLLVARAIRERAPEVMIVFGGPHVASDQSGDRALRTGIPDAVVEREGEETLVDLVRAVEAGTTDLSGIAGLGTLVEGEPVWGPKRPLIRKIDDLPFPDFTDFDWSQYSNPYLIPIMSSRGCVLDCAFCYETVFWQRFRTQRPDRIVAEIEHQVATHPMRAQAEADGERFYFMFADSLVNGHLGGLRRFAELLASRPIEVGWGGQATINTKMDANYFSKLKASGCTGLAFGLESGSQRVLESMGKHFHIDDAADFIRSAHVAGVTVTANIMVGYPNETGRDFVETLRFLARTRRWIYQVSNVTTTQIALGSDLHAHPEEYGVTIHPDGSWTSEATGDDLTRDRRLHLLHLWMQILRIPHQSVGTDHRRRARREQRAKRRNRRRLARSGAGADAITPPPIAAPEHVGPGWLHFDRDGSGPRDERPAWPEVEPPQVELRAAVDGAVTILRWDLEGDAPVDRASVEAGGMDALAELVGTAFPTDMRLDRPDPVDHEYLWTEGLDASGAERVRIAMLPIRDDDGVLTGLRCALGVARVGQAVAITARPKA